MANLKGSLNCRLKYQWIYLTIKEAKKGNHLIENEELTTEVKKTAIVLINLGTPDGPDVKAVRHYLSEFLNDPRVIDLPFVFRKILVNCIIVPFRAKKSAQLYQRLWTDRGSPLLYYTNQVQLKLQNKLDTKADVFMAMRYGNPAISTVLPAIRKGNYERLVVLPMFPQYASSTSESAIQAVIGPVRKWDTIPQMQVISQFYQHPAFLKAFAQRIQAYSPQDFDHLVFTFHGLPNRHLEKNHPGKPVANCSCENEMPAFGKFCYKAACYQTARDLAGLLGLSDDRYTVSFQSRLSNNWITPFTDEIIRTKAKQGIKKLLVAAPSFVTDCLETTVEIGGKYKELFIDEGGEHLEMVESLNDTPEWIDALTCILEPHLG